MAPSFSSFLSQQWSRLILGTLHLHLLLILTIFKIFTWIIETVVQINYSCLLFYIHLRWARPWFAKKCKVILVIFKLGLVFENCWQFHSCPNERKLFLGIRWPLIWHSRFRCDFGFTWSWIYCWSAMLLIWLFLNVLRFLFYNRLAHTWHSIPHVLQHPRHLVVGIEDRSIKRLLQWHYAQVLLRVEVHDSFVLRI